jgi:hypothetical protein
MDDDATPPPRRRRRLATGIGLVLAGAAVGGVTAATLSASADNTNTGPGTAAAAPANATPTDGQMFGRPHLDQPGGPQPVRGDETQLTGSDGRTATRAALAAVPGGRIYRAETDAGDGIYEVHMTRADGTPVTVKLDKSFTVTKVEAGMGTGDPALPR